MTTTVAKGLLTGTYEHTQSVAANVWTITHNLGTTAPVVDIILDDVAGDDQVMIAYDVVVTDANTVTVTLENPTGSPLPAGHTGRALVA